MYCLRTFTWPATLLHSDTELETRVWTVVSRLPIKHLDFSEPYVLRNFGDAVHFSDPTYPLWSITNLTSLSLSNAPFLWDKRCTYLLRSFLQSSPLLERLALSLAHRPFNTSTLFPFPDSQLHFPRLHTLRLLIFADPRTDSRPFAAFLAAHPTLRTLEWQYLAPAPLPPGSLPALMTLRGADDVDGLVGLLGGTSAGGAGRLLRSLAAPALTLHTLHILTHTLDAASLVRLELSSVDDLHTLSSLGDAFPWLKWLRIPRLEYGIHLDEWSATLSSFPNLEVFHGVSFLHDPHVATPPSQHHIHATTYSPLNHNTHSRPISAHKLRVSRRAHTHTRAGKKMYVPPGSRTWIASSTGTYTQRLSVGREYGGRESGSSHMNAQEPANEQETTNEAIAAHLLIHPCLRRIDHWDLGDGTGTRGTRTERVVVILREPLRTRVLDGLGGVGSGREETGTEGERDVNSKQRAMGVNWVEMDVWEYQRVFGDELEGGLERCLLTGNEG